MLLLFSFYRYKKDTCGGGGGGDALPSPAAPCQARPSPCLQHVTFTGDSGSLYTPGGGCPDTRCCRRSLRPGSGRGCRARAPDGGAAPGPLGRLDGGFLVTRLAVVQTLPPNLSTWRASWGAPTPCHSSTRSSQPGSAWEQLGALPGCPAPGGSENRSPPASHLERLVGPPAGAAGGAVSTLLLAQGLDPAGAGAGGEAGERQGAEPHVLA